MNWEFNVADSIISCAGGLRLIVCAWEGDVKNSVMFGVRQ